MDSLITDIKFNCDVSDSRYWGNFSICGLLMRLRDLYRSEKRLKPWDRIEQSEISQWIEEKEHQWAALEGLDFKDITVGGRTYRPFDVSEINDALKGTGLIYGAGYGLYMKPTFFIAGLHSRREVFGHTVYFVKEEFARDIFASSGMLQGRSILVRLDPLKSLLWEKFLESKAKNCSPLAEAFSAYGLRQEQDIDDAFEESLDALTGSYAEVVVSHELAEAVEDVPEWPDILSLLGDRHAEFFLRTLKDFVADMSESGPLKKIIETTNKATLALYVDFLGAYHKKMYPEIRESFRDFLQSEDWDALERTRKEGYSRFVSLREEILEAFRTSAGREDFLERVRAYGAAF